MTREEARRVLEELVRRSSPSREFLPHEPTPKQQEFLALRDFEAMYGGAAGGGKSDALLADQLQWVHVEGFAGLLLRRKFTQLEQSDSLIPRSHEWLSGTKAYWRGDKRTWFFPASSTLSFGHMNTELDKHSYQSGAWQRIGFDELTQFTESQYRYMHSRCRAPAWFPVPLGIRSATNPGGIGHDWVKERFVEPGDPTRPYVPALLADNPHLNQAAYLRALANLDATEQAQLIRGIWIRDSGGLIYPYRSINLIQAIPEAILPDLHHVLAIDLGTSEREATTAFVVLAYHYQLPGIFVRHARIEAGMWPSRIAEIIRELAAEFCAAQSSESFERIVVDEGFLGAGYTKEFAVEHGIACEAARKSEKLSYRRMLRGGLRSGLVQIVEPECGPLLEEISKLEWNEKGTDAQDGMADHASDALLYGSRACPAWAWEAPEPALPADPLERLREEERAWLQVDIEHARRSRSPFFGSSR